MSRQFTAKRFASTALGWPKNSRNTLSASSPAAASASPRAPPALCCLRAVVAPSSSTSQPQQHQPVLLRAPTTASATSLPIPHPPSAPAQHRQRLCWPSSSSVFVVARTSLGQQRHPLQNTDTALLPPKTRPHQHRQLHLSANYRSSDESSVLEHLHSIAGRRRLHNRPAQLTPDIPPNAPQRSDANMVDVVLDRDFPAANLVPKVETGVAAFLAKHPDYNGDGVTIAIFDSGVDPLAEGLQTTPDGQPKVIERYDCSGCGDVDTSTIVQASTDGTIVGLSGRVLRLTERMRTENASGEFRIGQKSLYELYPSKVRERIIGDAKLKAWDGPHKTALASVSRELDKLPDASTSAERAALSPADRLARDNAEQSLEVLNAFDKTYAGLKPLFDCVLYRTPDHGWRAVIDTSECGDLQSSVELGEYSRTHDIRRIAEHLSVSVNVHDDGNLLEVVGMCSSHGTHVASIASGNHTADPALHGVAPAAKIVSLTIGDTRLGSMETGTALVRAMIKVMELCEAGRPVHVINMSYGEHAHFSSSGRLGELMCEVVNRYGVVWVASAGNHGPALCTIGTPPDIVQPEFIGVGAYVSPDMIEAEYALRQKLPANCYTWTSRDPCIDGGQGVTVCAPGAAIASVPEFTQYRQQLMHGTSMAAPHVAGAVALLISGLLKTGIAYSPYGIKRALWNSATALPSIDPFAQGNGLLNVGGAFELLSAGGAPDALVRYAVSVDGTAKGIHVRQANAVAREHVVSVEPVFLNDKDVPPADKIRFNVRLTLVASEPWVKCGAFLDLCYTSRLFNVAVDPTGLPPGVHSARVRAYDSANVGRGTVFEVPVTVVQPHLVDLASSNVFALPPQTFRSQTIGRTFVQVPAKCTWAVLRLRSPNSTQSMPARFYVHTVQLAPQRFCKEYETQKLVSVHREAPTLHTFRVLENTVLEVCIAKFWSHIPDADVEASVEFRGLHSGAQALLPNPVHVMHSAGGIHRIDLTAPTCEDAHPAVQLKHAVMVLRPTETKITPLGVRDRVPHGRQIYQNVLTYALHLAKAQELTLHAPLLSDVLYESEFESQLWQLYDGNKLVVACGDAYASATSFKLDKGDYVARLQVRHERRDLLEKVNEATLLATFKLATAISMEAYTSYAFASNGAKKCALLSIARNQTKPIFLAPLANEKLTKANIPAQCSWLNGTLSLVKDETARKLESNNFRYILTEGPQVKKNSTGNNNGTAAGNSPSSGPATAGSPTVKDATATRNKFDEYKESLRDFKSNALQKLDLTDAKLLYEEIVAQHPDHLPAHVALINKLDPSAEVRHQMPFTFSTIVKKNGEQAEQQRETQNRIVQLADLVLNGTDQAALLAYLGMKVDHRPDAAKIKSAMDKQRSTLVEAMCRKGVALGKLALLNPDDAVANRAEIDKLYSEIGKFIDYSDSKLSVFLLWHSFGLRHHGRQAKILQKLHEDKLHGMYLEELHHVIADHSGWEHVAALIKRWATASNPQAYRLF